MIFLALYLSKDHFVQNENSGTELKKNKLEELFVSHLLCMTLWLISFIIMNLVEQGREKYAFEGVQLLPATHPLERLVIWPDLPAYVVKGCCASLGRRALSSY